MKYNFSEWAKLKENDNSADFGGVPAPEPNEDNWAQQTYDGQAEVGDALNQVSQALGDSYPSLLRAAEEDPNIADELGKLLQGQSQGGPPPEDMGGDMNGDMGGDPNMGQQDQGNPW